MSDLIGKKKKRAVYTPPAGTVYSGVRHPKPCPKVCKCARCVAWEKENEIYPFKCLICERDPEGKIYGTKFYATHFKMCKKHEIAYLRED